MPPHIRSATEADLPAIIELLGKKAEFDGDRAAFRATPEALRQAWFAETPLASVLLAEAGGRVIGLATYHSTFSTFLGRPGLWLDDLYLLEEFRSQGIGGALMAGLARVARDRGCGRIEWTVAVGNGRGIAFYERHQATVSHGTRHVRLTREGIERLANGRDERVSDIPA